MDTEKIGSSNYIKSDLKLRKNSIVYILWILPKKYICEHIVQIRNLKLFKLVRFVKKEAYYFPDTKMASFNEKKCIFSVDVSPCGNYIASGGNDLALVHCVNNRSPNFKEIMLSFSDDIIQSCMNVAIDVIAFLLCGKFILMSNLYFLYIYSIDIPNKKKELSYTHKFVPLQKILKIFPEKDFFVYSTEKHRKEIIVKKFFTEGSRMIFEDFTCITTKDDIEDFEFIPNFQGTPDILAVAYSSCIDFICLDKSDEEGFGKVIKTLSMDVKNICKSLKLCPYKEVLFCISYGGHGRKPDWFINSIKITKFSNGKYLIFKKADPNFNTTKMDVHPSRSYMIIGTFYIGAVRFDLEFLNSSETESKTLQASERDIASTNPPTFNASITLFGKFKSQEIAWCAKYSPTGNHLFIGSSVSGLIMYV